MAVHYVDQAGRPIDWAKVRTDAMALRDAHLEQAREVWQAQLDALRERHAAELEMLMANEPKMDEAHGILAEPIYQVVDPEDGSSVLPVPWLSAGVAVAFDVLETAQEG